MVSAHTLLRKIDASTAGGETRARGRLVVAPMYKLHVVSSQGTGPGAAGGRKKHAAAQVPVMRLLAPVELMWSVVKFSTSCVRC